MHPRHAYTHTRTHAHTHTHANASLEYPITFIFHVLMNRLRTDAWMDQRMDTPPYTKKPSIRLFLRLGFVDFQHIGDSYKTDAMT